MLFFCLVQRRDAGDGFLRQNMMPRRLRAHPARQRRKGRKKRVESLREGEGGGGGKLRIHRFALNQTKSKFLRVLVAMQPSKWAGNLRGRGTKDTHGHLHFTRSFFSPSIPSRTHKMAIARSSDEKEMR